MTKQEIKDLILKVRQERKIGGNTKNRIANILDGIIDLNQVGQSTYDLWLSLGNTGTVIDFIEDITYLNSMQLTLVDGDLIVENYMGDSIEIIDGELILN